MEKLFLLNYSFIYNYSLSYLNGYLLLQMQKLTNSFQIKQETTKNGRSRIVGVCADYARKKVNL